MFLEARRRLNKEKKPYLFDEHSITNRKVEVFGIREIKERYKTNNKRILGRLCFEKTNSFRISKKLKKLEWNEELYKIGYKHSENMANYKIPFGHHGFSKRSREISISYSGVIHN